MKLKQVLINFHDAYLSMRKEALAVLKNVRPKLKSASDAEEMQEFIERKYFFWKDDIRSVIRLAKKYNVSSAKLEKIWNSFAKIERNIISIEPILKKLGFKRFDFDPYAISAHGPRADLVIYVDAAVTVGIYPKDERFGLTDDFIEYAKDLKDEMNKILNANI